MSSPQSCARLIGRPITTATQSPTRSERRTMRGWPAPKACAASGATAETGPMPNTNPTNKMRCARPTAAMAPSPSRPMSARSVVIMAIWPSWVSAMGHASLTVSIISARQTPCPARAAALATVIVPGSIMARAPEPTPWQEKGATGGSRAIRGDEELAITVAAWNDRRLDAGDLPAARRDDAGDVLAYQGVKARIAHDASFRAPGARLELRFDERKQTGRGAQQREGGRQGELERDEAHIDDGEVWPLGQPRRIEGANVRCLERNDLRSATQASMQLVATHIDGIDPPGAACQQDLGKAAGRGADVETHTVARVEQRIGAEMIECGRELYAAARHVRVRRVGAKHGLSGNLLRWPCDDNLVGTHATGGDRALRLRAAREQAALDEKPVNANAAGHALCSAQEMMSGLTLNATSEVRGGTNNDTCLLFQTTRHATSRRAGIKPAWIDRESNNGA